MNYNSRPKINSKIIFNHVPENTKNVLIIGENNSDIVEIIKQKKIKFDELHSGDEREILNYLSEKQDKKISIIILNLELCNFANIEKIINAVTDKSEYSIIRFRNKTKKSKVSKRKKICGILNSNRINILKKFYSKKNFVSSSLLFKPFSYYSVYFISRDKPALNHEPSFVEKIKNLILSKKEMTKLAIMKKVKYGK